MRYVVLVVLGLFVACCIVGCTFGVSKEDTAMLKELRMQWNTKYTERKVSLEALYSDRKAAYDQLDLQKRMIMDKVDSGTIPLAEAQKFITVLNDEFRFTLDRINAEIEQVKDDFDEQAKITQERIKELEAKGYTWWQILGGLLGSFGSGLLIDRKKLAGVIS